MGKISEATLRTTLKGTENIPITDTDLPKGRTTAANLKTFVTPDLSGYATIDDIPSVDGFITKTDADGYYQAKGNYLTTVPAEYITETELSSKGYATQASVNAKQDALVSGTNIKTINYQSLLGQGNIEITVEGGGITDAPSDGKMYGRKDAQWSEVVIPDTSDILTKTEAASTYQSKGEYLTSIPEEYVTDEELNGKGYATTSQLGAKLDTETYNLDKATFATKAELASKADASALASKQDTLVSGTNIKTINGETILGSGDIEVESEPTAIVDHGTSDTTFELTPNILHKWDEVVSLTLTLGTETPNIVNEFMIQFTSGATATQLSLPETVKWLNTPEIAANMVYQISILNNLAVIGGWSNA